MVKKSKEKANKGITLIVLVVTIVVLIILAGITIASLTGEKGIIRQANEAERLHSHACVEEAIALEYVNYVKTITSGGYTNDPGADSEIRDTDMPVEYDKNDLFQSSDSNMELNERR